LSAYSAIAKTIARERQALLDDEDFGTIPEEPAPVLRGFDLWRAVVDEGAFEYLSARRDGVRYGNTRKFTLYAVPIDADVEVEVKVKVHADAE
jgi:hypothetical protein